LAAAAILKKSKNLNMLAAVQAISTKFGTVMLFDPVKNLNFENPRWLRPPS